MPPEAISINGNKNRRSLFYHLLPPQLVRSNKAPLCSDAFTKWNSTNVEADKIESEQRVRFCFLFIQYYLLVNIFNR